MRRLKIVDAVYDEILSNIANAPIESGGITACDGTGVVCDFCFCAGSGLGEYVIDTKKFNAAIAVWKECGYGFCGIVHSHPHGVCDISPRDIEYARRILACNPFMDRVVMGIVAKTRKFGWRSKWYAVSADGCKTVKAERIER